MGHRIVMNQPVRIKVLGPWQVSAGDRPVDIPSGHQRVLLSSLLLSAGQPVLAGALAQRLWDDRHPVNVRGTLSTYATRLRGALGKEVIITCPGGGYRLAVDEDQVDLHRFRRLLRHSRAAGSARAELALLREALDLWGGRPFTGVESDWLDRDVVPSLTEEWFTATERRIDLDLAQGTCRGLIAELSELTTWYPLRETLWSRLISVLRQSGRRADALTAYQQIRTILRDSLGVDPSEELQRLHQDVLRKGSAGPAAPASHTPRQLPHDNAKFVGRRNELAALDELTGPVGSTVDSARPPTVIVTIDGVAGTGKTTLAVHWAHRMTSRYPDVQLYLNLRGHCAGSVRPAAAAESMLRSLGIPAGRVPATLDERSALLRSTLAGRRCLVLLDDARDAGQVRALIPGAGALVIVTSRDQLPELSIRDGAQRLSLRQLGPADAIELLGMAAGPQRVAAEPQAARQLVELCGGLPLALAVVAERAHRADTLSQLAQTILGERSGRRRALSTFPLAYGARHPADAANAW
jgi:DNA-binding SARP family transcriptional activator